MPVRTSILQQRKAAAAAAAAAAQAPASSAAQLAPFQTVDLTSIGSRLAQLKGLESYTICGSNPSRFLPPPSARSDGPQSTRLSVASSAAPTAGTLRATAPVPVAVPSAEDLAVAEAAAVPSHVHVSEDPATGLLQAPDRTRRLTTAAEVAETTAEWQFSVVDVQRRNRLRVIRERSRATKESNNTQAVIEAQRAQATAPTTLHSYSNYLVSSTRFTAD